MYDISSLDTFDVTNNTIKNENFIAHASTLFMETVMKVPRMNDFKRLKKNEQEEILEEIIKKNKREITKEIERLLKISVRFMNTQYFHDLAKLLRIYNDLLNSI